MPTLVNINIKFHTYDDNLNDDTNLHVFVKNRRVAKPRSDTASVSLGPTSFIQNQLDFAEAVENGTSEFNPFLGRLLNVTNGHGFDNNSDHSFDFPPLDMILLEASQAQTNAILDRVYLEIYTHDQSKDSDTVVNVHIVNRISATESTDISVALNILPGQGFDAPSKYSLDLPLASDHILPADIVLPVVNINIAPTGNHR